ncbi:hypothetical protein SK128_015421, partial [Halocaridina rubra]
SFFGRTYNNLSSLSECKNSGRCIINKKTRTSCKSCRLRKCLMVGMSKSGSRYGRRSNWFKIHYLMQNNNNNNSSNNNHNISSSIEIPSEPTVASLADTQSTLDLRKPPRTNQSLSPVSKDCKMPHDSNLDTSYKLGSEFQSSQEKNLYHSPTTSSTESQNSDLTLDLEENPVIPPYPEQLYPKDLLSMCNLPALTEHLPIYVPSQSLAQRYLYPYYSSLFSVYSQSQYLDKLLQEAKQKEHSNSGHENDDGDDEDDDDDEIREKWSYNCRTATQIFCKCGSRLLHRKSALCTQGTPSIITEILSQHPSSLVRESINGKNSERHDAPCHNLLLENGYDNITVGTTPPQDLPIDLSTKNTMKNYSVIKLGEFEQSMHRTSFRSYEQEDNQNTKRNHKEDEKEEEEVDEIIFSPYQHMPLDLSYIGS